MNSGSTDLATLAASLVAFGPVLYVGVSIVVDPATFWKFLMWVVAKIERSQDGLHDPRWASDEVGEMSSAVTLYVRISGLMLVLFALIHLLGLVPL